MPVNKIPFTRGGENYQGTLGINQGKSSLFLEPEKKDPVTEQQRRIFPVEMTVKFSENTADGSVVGIRTQWQSQLISNVNGQPIPGTQVKLPMMVTNQADIDNFVAMFGMPILISMLNGYVRALMGYNTMPVFNSANGQLLQFSAEELAAPPSNDYNGKPPAPYTPPVEPEAEPEEPAA